MEPNFYLSQEALTVIGAGLAELPYKVSAPVIDDINKQIAALNAPTPAPPTPAPVPFGEAAEADPL